jgi:hypothetical protein
MLCACTFDGFSNNFSFVLSNLFSSALFSSCLSEEICPHLDANPDQLYYKQKAKANISNCPPNTNVFPTPQIKKEKKSL